MYQKLIIIGNLGSNPEMRFTPNGSPRTFQRKDGTWASSYEITADSVRFLDGKARDDVDDSYSADVPF